jgi:hypothetical protein
MSETKIFNNQNKIIAKLPTEWNRVDSSNKKTCESLVGNIIKLKLIEPIYLNLELEDIVQTFLYLFNNNEGKGIFINISKNKIKDFIIFSNETKSKIISKDLNLITKIKKILELVLSNSDIKFNLMFFINLSNYPVLYNELYQKQRKHFVPVISFNSSYTHYDIPLPLPYNNSFKKEAKHGLSFIFEKRKIDDSGSESSKIYKRLLEIKSHPYYKSFNLDYIVVDGLNDEINYTSMNVIISDPYVPNYFQYYLLTHTQIILIENPNNYSYYSKLLVPNKEYISWSMDKWEEQMDKLVENKPIIKNLKIWSDKNITNEQIKDKYLGFLEHLNQNYYYVKEPNLTKMLPITDSFSLAETNLNITTQLDYDKFFDLLYKNYKMIRCWSYRLNPYSSLLTRLKTNHNFVPEFIKLSLKSLGPFEHINWISQRRVLLDHTKFLLNSSFKYDISKSSSKDLKKIKSVNNYIIKNTEELLNLKIINNIESVFYIELPEPSSKFNLWENDFISDLESILQFISKQPIGSSFIIKIYTFELSRTTNLIHKFSEKFEQIKILKNEWFDSFLPFRYLVGINLTNNKSESKITLDLETYNRMYFSLETQELIKMIKWIKSDSIVNIQYFLNDDLIIEWLNKWFSTYLV